MRVLCHPSTRRLAVTIHFRNHVFAGDIVGTDPFRARHVITMTTSLWQAMLFLLCWAVGYLQLTVWLLPVLLWLLIRHLTSPTPPPTTPTVNKPLPLPSETAHWLNVLVNKWLLVASPSLLPLLKEHVDAMLISQSLPIGVDHLELVSVDWANASPSFTNVHVMECYHANSKPDDYSQSDLLINADVLFHSGDGRVELRAVVGGKRMNFELQVMLEAIRVSGSVQAFVRFSDHVSLPHVSMVNLTFKKRPEVWFSVGMGRDHVSSSLLHCWLHHFLLDCFHKSLVDPYQLTINLDKQHSRNHDNHAGPCVGVLTVVVMATSLPSQAAKGSSRFLTASFFGQKKYFDIPNDAQHWKTTFSFFVDKTNFEMLQLKIKQRRLLHNKNLAAHALDLHALGLLRQPGSRGNDNAKDHQISKHTSTSLLNAHYSLALNITYTRLPPVSMTTPTSIERLPQQFTGVVAVCIHSVELSAEIGSCDLYCVVTIDNRQVLVTSHQSDCRSACWDHVVEVMTADCTKPITFELLHWCGPIASSNLIGYDKLSLGKETQLVRHNMSLHCHDNKEEDTPVAIATVSVIFRPVDCLRYLSEGVSSGQVSMDTLSVSSYDSRESFKMKGSTRQRYHHRNKLSVSTVAGKGVVELSIIKGRGLVPMDTNGLSNPYVEVKFGQEVMYRTRVVKRSLDPNWAQSVSLTAPGRDDIVTMTCWDRNHLSDGFMGSLQLPSQSFNKFKTGPKWCPLQLISSGELLLDIKELIPGIQLPGNTYDDSSLQTVEGDSVDGCSLASQLEMRSLSDNELLVSRRTQLHYPVTATDTVSLTAITSMASSAQSTVDLDSSLDAPIVARYPTTTKDIEHALRQSPRVTSVIYCLRGCVFQVDGLKGSLSRIELYVKIRLNSSNPGSAGLLTRGNTIFKTRAIRGQSNPHWTEPFAVKEGTVYGSSLMTVDLKSGSKVNIGTHSITLDKFFEGTMKKTKWLDIGNDARLQLELTRNQQPVHDSGLRHSIKRSPSTAKRSPSREVRPLH